MTLRLEEASRKRREMNELGKKGKEDKGLVTGGGTLNTKKKKIPLWHLNIIL